MDEKSPPAAEPSAPDTMVADLGAQSPALTEVVPFHEIQMLVDALNAALAFLSDGKMPPVAYAPESAAGGTQAPLPPEVFAYLAALGMTLGEIAKQKPEFAELVYNPMGVTTRRGMQDVTAKLAMVARNPDLKAIALAAADGMEAPAEAPAEAPPPSRAPYGDMAAPVPPESA